MRPMTPSWCGPWLGTLACATFFVILMNPLLRAQDCLTCTPAHANAQLGGFYLVCVSPGEFSSVQLAAVHAGNEYWKNHLSNQGILLDFLIIEEDIGNTACDMRVYAMSMGPAAQALATASGNGSEIRINEASLWRTSPDYWNELLGHEWGHVFGLQDVNNAACTPFTIMVNGASHGSLPTSPICGDVIGMNSRYAANSGTSSDIVGEPAPGEGYCYDVYRVYTTWYVWSDGRVTQGPSWVHYLGTECSPNPIMY